MKELVCIKEFDLEYDYQLPVKGSIYTFEGFDPLFPEYVYLSELSYLNNDGRRIAFNISYFAEIETRTEIRYTVVKSDVEIEEPILN